MKKILSKWEKISIKHKLFGITSGLLILLALVTYIISIFVGGSFNDFCENAIKWVLAGIGISFTVTYLININRNNKFQFIKGDSIMKKLQISSIILLLLGIWLSIAPIGQSSNLPELASIVSVVCGLICGVVSLFF